MPTSLSVLRSATAKQTSRLFVVQRTQPKPAAAAATVAAANLAALLICQTQRRWTTSLPGDNSSRQENSEPNGDSEPSTDVRNGREPVESVLQRILEPAHAESIGLTPENTATKNSKDTGNSNALVPLNTIYLPPPKWHTPLKPVFVRKSLSENQSGVASAPKPYVGCGPQSHLYRFRVVLNSARDDAADGYSDTNQLMATGARSRSEGILARLLKAFTTRTTTGRNTQAVAGKDAANSADNLMRGAAESFKDIWHNGAVRRALELGRRKINAIKALPRDDDWVTWLGKVINRMSGYDTIAGLKAKVEVAGEQFIKARLDLKEIERSHARTIQSRISSQREINSLLQRKHMWNEEDVARFTSLYRDEHQAEMSERQASKLLKDAEGLVDRQYDSLVNAIRERYHEEQTWSDKIRQLSTYSTWAILTMNILVLFITLAIFEPRKRRKIVDGVDEKLTLAITGQNAVIKQANDSVEQQLWQQQKTINDLAEHAVHVSTALASISAKQNTEMAALSTHLLNSTHAPDTSPDAANDTELDMYYQQASAKPQPSWWVPGSAIWRTLTHSNANTRATSTAIANQRNDGRRRQQQQQQEEEAFTKAEASQLAIEAAAVASLVTAALTYYFST